MQHQARILLSLILIISLFSQSAFAFLPLGADNIIIQNIQSSGKKQGTYNQTLANNAVINTAGYKLNFINGTGNPVNVKNSTNGMVNVTITVAPAGASVTSLNALTGALTIACVSGNTTCTTSGGNTITINTAYNIVTTGLSAQTITKALTLNNMILGGQMNINGQTMQSGGHVYSWPTNTGTVCLTNQTGPCGPMGSATYDTMANIGTGQGSVYAGNTTKTNFQFKTLKQGSNILITNNTNDLTIAVTGLLSSAITSVNSQTGPSITINRGSVTNMSSITNSSNVISYQLKNNIVLTNGSSQTITKGLTLNSLTLGGNAIGNSKNFTGLSDTNSTRFFQGSNRVVDTISGTAPITATKSGASYTVACPTCGTGSGTVTGSQNAGKSTGSVGVLATGTSTTIKGRNMTGTSPIVITKTNDTDIAISCSTCITSAVTSITGTSHNVTASSSTGAVTLNTGDAVVVTTGSDQNFTSGKKVTHTPSSSKAGINFGSSASDITSPRRGDVRIVGNSMKFNDNTNTTQTITPSSYLTSAVTSLNALNGALTIAGTSGNITASTAGSTITLNTAFNVVITGGSAQVFSKNLDFGVTNTDKFGATAIIIRNPTTTFATTLSNSAITANRTLTLPLTTQTETVSVVAGTNFTSPSNPATTTSTTGVMSNLFATFTPKVTGNIIINICGQMSSGTATDGAKFDIRIGTSQIAEGTAIGNTLIGTAKGITSSTASTVQTACDQVYKSGLTVGTKEFIQIGKYAVTGGTASFSNFDVFIMEVE